MLADGRCCGFIKIIVNMRRYATIYMMVFSLNHTVHMVNNVEVMIMKQLFSILSRFINFEVVIIGSMSNYE